MDKLEIWMQAYGDRLPKHALEDLMEIVGKTNRIVCVKCHHELQIGAEMQLPVALRHMGLSYGWSIHPIESDTIPKSAFAFYCPECGQEVEANLLTACEAFLNAYVAGTGTINRQELDRVREMTLEALKTARGKP